MRFRVAGEEHELRVRLHRRLRRLPRRVPRGDPGRRAHASSSGRIPFAWLGILAAVPPSLDELIYAYHERGFALHSMRSPDAHPAVRAVRARRRARGLAGRAHLGRAARAARDAPTAGRCATGPVLEKSITTMRSFVVEPMQYGRLFLAGDAAHVVPPTGAKGMNLAIADVRVLGRGARRVVSYGATDAARRVFARPACGASGAPSTSPGG